MIQTGYYLATRKVAERCGNIYNTYRVADGRYVVSDRHLKRLVLSPQEYITGIEGIEMVSEQEALKLIKANGKKKGYDTTGEVVEKPQPAQESEENNEEPKDKEE